MMLVQQNGGCAWFNICFHMKDLRIEFILVVLRQFYNTMVELGNLLSTLMEFGPMQGDYITV